MAYTYELEGVDLDTEGEEGLCQLVPEQHDLRIPANDTLD